MEWKDTLSGVVIGAILAGAGVLFLFQERISKLEVRVTQLEGGTASAIPRDSDGVDTTAGDLAEHWDGTWEHTEAIVGGTGAFTGTMRLYVKAVGRGIEVPGTSQVTYLQHLDRAKSSYDGASGPSSAG